MNYDFALLISVFIILSITFKNLHNYPVFAYISYSCAIIKKEAHIYILKLKNFKLILLLCNNQHFSV